MNTSNFLQYAKLEFLINRKAVLLTVVGILAVFIFFGAFLGYNGLGGGLMEKMALWCMAFVISLAAASVCFSNMKSKERRICSLMIPVSAREKYLLRWLIVTPGLFLLLCASLYLADISRVVTFLIFNSDGYEGERYIRIINPWTEPVMSRYPVIAFLPYGIYFFYQAAYFLGAVLWPKLSFIKTFAAVSAIQFVVTNIFIIFLRNVIYSFSDSEANVLLWIVFGLLCACAVGMYWLGYVRYRNSQVVYKLF